MKEGRKVYERVMKIGEGAYGSVFKALDTESNKFVALKITKFDKDDEGIPSTTLREMSILQSLDHPCIVKLLDIVVQAEREPYYIQFVFEFLEEDLGKFIKRRKQNITQNEYKIVLGVKYMHDRKIYHRDLKPQNILISKQMHIKIADFGLSRVIVNPLRTFSKQIQTLWYRSPELLLGMKHYGMGVDIWSLGCILYELAEGKVLFKGDSQIGQIFTIFHILGTPKVQNWPGVTDLQHFKKTYPKMQGQWPNLINLGEECFDLLLKLLEPNPKKRINIQEVLKHPFLKD